MPLKIRIEDREPRDAKHPYTNQNVWALQQASQVLSGSAFKIWILISKNQDDFEVHLGPAVAESWGVKKDAYYKGLEELKAKGYLIEKRGGAFSFYEVPWSVEGETKNEIKKSKGVKERLEISTENLVENNQKIGMKYEF